MQIAGDQVIVMTKGAEFKRIPYAAGMEVGQEVQLPAAVLVKTAGIQAQSRRWWNTRFKQAGVVAAALLLAVGVWSSQTFMSATPAYAYVTLDINPSIELSVDSDRMVLHATALNEDGERVLSELALVGLAVQDAISKVASAAESRGYLEDDAEVIITASLAEEAETASSDELAVMEDELVSTVQNVAVAAGTEVAVEGIVVSKAVRSAAQEAGLSPGKYAFYLTAQAQGIDVELEDLKKNPIQQLVDDQGNTVAKVVQNLNGGQQLDKLNSTYKQEGKSGLSKGNSKTVVFPKKEEVKLEAPKTAPGQEKKQQQEPASGNKKQDTPSSKQPEEKSNKNDDKQKGTTKSDNHRDMQNGRDKKGSDPSAQDKAKQSPSDSQSSKKSSDKNKDQSDNNDKNRGNDKKDRE